MGLVLGIVVVILVMVLLGKLADHFEERSFLLWLLFYLAAGSLGIILLYAATHAGR